MSLKDEPDFEVTDLRTGRRDERVYAHEEERWQRRKTLGVVVTALVLICALAIPFFSVPGFGASMRRTLHLPTPTPPSRLAEGADVVYFEHGLPWGALLMDGKPVTNVDAEQPYTGFEQLYTSLRVPRGRHLLTYTAAPFPVLRCWISAPAADNDTCPLIQDRGVQDVSPPFATERVLNLGGDPTLLPPPLLAALKVAAIRTIATLSSSATLAPGDAYAGADGAPHIASSRMTATLTYAITTDPANVYIIPGSIRSCVILCAIQAASYLNDSQSQWVVAAHVLPTWIYRQENGATITGSAAPQGVMSDSIVPLSVTWKGAWQVKIADSMSTSPICFIALNLFSALHLGGAPLSSLQLFAATPPAAGCLAAGDAVDATGVPSIPFTVMYRFGLLFAVDAEARRLLPGMPPADARLQALARAWAG